MTLSGVADHARIALIWWIALFLLVLPGVLGSIGSIVAVLGALALAPVVIGRGRLRDVAFGRTGAIFAAVFLALAIAFTITARDPGNILYALDFLALPLSLAVALAFADQPLKKIGRLLPALCAVGAAIALLVAANDVFLLARPRALGFISGGNLLARVALLQGAMALGGALADRSGRRFLYYGGFVAAFAATYLTGSRGAMIAVPVMLAVFGYFLVTAPGARRPWRHLAGLGAALVLTYLALSLATALIDAGRSSQRFESVVGVAAEALSGADVSDAATYQRLAMAKAAFEAFRAAPLFGYGWANLSAAAPPQLGGEPWFKGGSDPHFQFHSDPANMAVAAGIVGLACWLALLIAPLAGALASARDGLFRLRLYACVQLSLTYLVFGLTDMNFGYDLPTTLYAFIAAVVLGAFAEAPAPA